MAVQTIIKHRRDTAANWTSTNPTLASGEKGIETDTGKEKLGNGITAWVSLAYHNPGGAVPQSQVTDLVSDLAAKASSLDLSTHASDTTSVHGIADTSLLETASGAQLKADQAEIDAKAYADSLAVNYDAAGAASTAQSNANTYTDSEVATALTTAQGYADTAEADAKAYADSLAVNYDAAGSASAAQTAAQGYADSAVSTHNLSTTSVHGIADTSLLATKAYADNAAATAVAAVVDAAPGTLDTLNELAAALGDDANYAATVTTALGTKQDKVTGVSDAEIGYLDGVTSAIQAQIDGKAATSHTHTVSEITDYTPVDISGKQDKIAGVSDTEIGYLSNVTSDIQAQLDAGLSSNAPTITNPTFIIDGISTYATTSSSIYNGMNSGEIQFKIFSPSGIPSIATVGSTVYLTSTADPSLTGGLDIDNINFVIDSVNDFGMYVEINAHTSNSANNAEVDDYTNYFPYGLTSVVMNKASSKTIIPANIGHLDAPTITDPTFTINDVDTYSPTDVSMQNWGAPDTGVIRFQIWAPSGAPSLATVGSTIYLTGTSQNSLNIDNVNLVIDSVDDFGMYVQIMLHAASAGDNAAVDAYLLGLTGNLTTVVMNKASSKTITPADISSLVAVPSADKSADYTLTSGDKNSYIRSTDSAITITVPDVLIDGQSVNFIQAGTGQITFSGSGVTLYSADSLTKTAKQYAGATIVKSGGAYYLIGNLG